LRKKRKKSLKKISPTSLFSKKNLAIFLIIFSLPIMGIFALNYLDVFQKEKQESNIDHSTQKLMDKMKKMLDDEKNRLTLEVQKNTDSNDSTYQKYPKLPPVITHKKEQEVKKTDEHFSEISDYKKSLEQLDKDEDVKITKKPYIQTGKPKLAIIIDDVSYEHQVRMIENIPYKITPSFFPPTSRHPDTVKLASRFEFAMIHLPMEALSYTKPEPSTLVVSDSSLVMQKRIRELKKLFPRISYYNNHTGSKFTANQEAMDRLFQVFKDENLSFVDSRTTAKTKAPFVAQKYGMNLLSRDVFLDNEIEKNAIQKQLVKAVNLAKKHGFAIAIGHPHTNTLTVLKEAKAILRDVDVVYVKDL
jgi:polysaccharide deacetylase 2 family uncharacterized protein YibQ